MTACVLPSLHKCSSLVPVSVWERLSIHPRTKVCPISPLWKERDCNQKNTTWIQNMLGSTFEEDGAGLGYIHSSHFIKQLSTYIMIILYHHCTTDLCVKLWGHTNKTSDGDYLCCSTLCQPQHSSLMSTTSSTTSHSYVSHSILLVVWLLFSQRLL